MAWDAIIYLDDADLDMRLNIQTDSLCALNLKKSLSKKEKLAFQVSRSNSINNIGTIYFSLGNPEKALDYFLQGLKIREDIGDKNETAASLNNIGTIYSREGDFENAILYLKKSLRLKEEIGEKNGIAMALSNLGVIYNDKGDFVLAITYFTKSLKIREQIGKKADIAISLINIGNVYGAQNDFPKAIEYFTKSLKITEASGDKKGTAMSLLNLGTVYLNKGENELALDYLTKSLKLFTELEYKAEIAVSLDGLGSVYSAQGNYPKAIVLLTQALKIQEEIGDLRGMLTSLTNLGNYYVNQNLYKKAVEYGTKALEIAKEYGVHNEVKIAAELLWKAYKKLGKYKESLDVFELYISTRDTLQSAENQKAIINQEYKYQYEKQAAADSIVAQEADRVKDALLIAEQAESKKNKLEAEQQKQRGYFLYGGLALAILFGGFIFNRFKVTSKQKSIIEDQKKRVDEAFDELGEKNREILDSINYAKRIQSAILPPSKVVKEYLQESFILYKPKDIVAGDFYWLEHKDGKVLFAAADCTGHGVPGAMVSVICNNGLNRSVREYGITDPGKILDKTREIVIQEFEKSEEEVKDGMDIALCSLEGNTLKYAGAHNPLWIIRKGEVLETKADKQPIGKFDGQLPYTTHTFELEKGDSLYIFSDGYVDQFGGEKGKKFKSKAFRELLLSIQDKSMEEQRLLIDETFENWRGTIEQIDDVCVIGVKI